MDWVDRRVTLQQIKDTIADDSTLSFNNPPMNIIPAVCLSSAEKKIELSTIIATEV